MWLSFIGADGSFAVDVLPASLVTAAGMAMAFIPSLGTGAVLGGPEEGGLASGIVNTNYQVGSALGLAAMTAVASAFGADQVGDAVAQTDGFSAGLLGAAGIAAAGALVAAAWLRTPERGRRRTGGRGPRCLTASRPTRRRTRHVHHRAPLGPVTSGLGATHPLPHQSASHRSPARRPRGPATASSPPMLEARPRVGRRSPDATGWARR